MYEIEADPAGSFFRKTTGNHLIAARNTSFF
jgi:hypothetical protein